MLKLLLDAVKFSLALKLSLFHRRKNPRLIMRRSSLHHSWVPLNFDARFND